jgi:predicted dehydrogenase
MKTSPSPHRPPDAADPPLKAIVIGAGYAGQGHTKALREAGVDVVGLAGRTVEVGAKVALELGIPIFDHNWRALLQEARPQIVAIATPGGTHFEMIKAAIDAGCHVFADKPLATTADDARQLFERARLRGVKTAYAASYWYQPQALFARELVRQGVLGKVYEVEAVSHFHWPPRMPFGWPHRLDTGGGRLNNNFPHLLAITQNVLDGEVLAATGECRNDLKQVPVAEAVHDFREFARRALTEEEAARRQWAEVTSDWAYTAVLRIGNPNDPLEAATTATFRHSALRLGRYPDYIAFYGENGTLHVDGTYMQGPVYLRTDGPNWEQLGVPPHILDALPAESDDTQRNWNQLAREFVADVRGQEHPRYLTFEDGWIYQQVIDAIRATARWVRPGIAT